MKLKTIVNEMMKLIDENLLTISESESFNGFKSLVVYELKDKVNLLYNTKVVFTIATKKDNKIKDFTYILSSRNCEKELTKIPKSFLDGKKEIIFIKLSFPLHNGLLEFSLDEKFKEISKIEYKSYNNFKELIYTSKGGFVNEFGNKD